MEHYQKTAHTQNSNARENKIGSISWNPSNGKFFSSSSLAGWDDVSSRWVPLLNLSFLFFFHRPYVWFIYLLFTVYFDFGRIFLFSYFFGACDGDDLSSSGSESPYTISLLLFSSFASKWEREKRSRYRCRHSCRDEDGREKCAGGIA